MTSRTCPACGAQFALTAFESELEGNQGKKLFIHCLRCRHSENETPNPDNREKPEPANVDITSSPPPPHVDIEPKDACRNLVSTRISDSLLKAVLSKIQPMSTSLSGYLRSLIKTDLGIK